MKILFNKTFFRFLFGFFTIIVASFLILSLVGYYEEKQASGGEVATEVE